MVKSMRNSLCVAAVFLAGCAAYSGGGLQPGLSGEPEIRATMGVPAMQWELAGGGRQLAYPRGPAGFHTYMVFIDSRGRLERSVNVLDQEYFARVQSGMTQAEVLQLLGPPEPQWTAYFAARNELVWEWRYCDSWNEAARFDVLFDGTTKTVRSTQTWTEGQKMEYPIRCGR